MREVATDYDPIHNMAYRCWKLGPCLEQKRSNGCCQNRKCMGDDLGNPTAEAIVK